MRKELLKKGGNTKGERTQKMMSFRVDCYLIDWLNEQPNKGRLINDLLHQEYHRQISEKGGT